MPGMMKAQEALQYRLVNYVVSLNELMPKCMEIISSISNNSPQAISSAIKAVNAGYTSGLNGYEVEIEEFAKCFGTDEFKEGTTAFLEKRKANFRK